MLLGLTPDSDNADLDKIISYKEMIIELIDKGEKLVHLINANDASEVQKNFINTINNAKKLNV
jgi:hypothetical protein